MPQELVFTRPDDWHVHLRDGDMLRVVVRHTARQFARAIIMPNLNPPVITVGQALAYRRRILDALPERAEFTPLMTLYLTDHTAPAEVEHAKATGLVHGLKFYPAGATTHSAHGVTALHKVFPVLEAMQAHDLPLLVHGEVVAPEVDIFDREKVFIERELIPLVERFPALRVVLEHITTQDAVQYIASAPPNIAATITAHHLLLNRNALLVGGIWPHHYCLPVLKREAHRQALVEAVTCGNPKFFLGTDSAPHPRDAKESACGCAGVYTAHAALELYAEAFAEAGAFDKLEGFASFHGADFYQLPRNTSTVTLVHESWKVPNEFAVGERQLVPLRAGTQVQWRLVGTE